MPNMSYCRFQNTLKDLQDCSEHMDDELSEDEEKARTQLVDLCIELANYYGDDDNNEEEE